MKQILHCIFIILLTTECFGQHVTFNKGGIGDKNYYQEIPYELVNGRIFLISEVNRIKRRFLFDTGAPTQVTVELFEELKPAIVNHTDITDAAGNKTALDIVSIKVLHIGDLTFNDIPALVTGSQMYRCLKIDGVIGSNMLRKSVVQILPEKHIIILTDDETRLTINRKNQTDMMTGEPQSYPYFMLQLSNKNTVKVGFDSGADNLLRLTEKDARRLVKSGVFQKVSTGYGSSNRGLLGLQAPDSLYRLKMLPINLAGCVFNNVFTETSKSSNSRIGAKLLDYGNVTLDFIHHLFYFDPLGQSNDVNDMPWPLKPVIEGDKLTVGVVWESLKGKIQSGDQILSVDGESCEAIGLCDWLNGKSETLMPNKSAVLSIRDRKGNIKEIHIDREP
ncbi:retropepsin-like aspartic protease [Dyadobacter frigoris]|uniref:Aspartyl protease n=1 Tax=Dyadobacter frigoris TaxID=2576211 RepID=A0A4U6D629_9BACT|nr:aspartyl protease family protein [Dyadobacter frigoris]TKT92839.1 hypothetical protein FDK13_08595 [Dyadobacter frigoris]